MQAEIRISGAALRANLAAIRRYTGGVRIMSVVKANAYGHGLEIVARAIATSVDAFGVYEVAEATALRACGITQPLHLLGPVQSAELDDALAANATLPLWDRGWWLADLRAAATRAGKRARVQLKIDSGLSRLGIAPVDVPSALAEYCAAPELDVTGAYSHLAAAEELDSRFTLEQLERFSTAIPVGAVRERHIASSAAALLWPQTRLDCIRVGIAQYGIWPSDVTRTRLAHEVPLQPVMTWQTRVSVLRDVAAETPIGYGSTYRPPNAARIAVLPIGYAEGLPRALSNRGHVLVEGVACPIVGRVCMNMTFVDVSAAGKTGVGSRATIIGRDGDALIDAEDVARAADTIGYEIVARLPREIPRFLIDKESAA